MYIGMYMYIHSSLKLAGQRRAKDGQDQETSTSLEQRKKGLGGRELFSTVHATYM